MVNAESNTATIKRCVLCDAANGGTFHGLLSHDKLVCWKCFDDMAASAKEATFWLGDDEVRQTLVSVADMSVFSDEAIIVTDQMPA